MLIDVKCIALGERQKKERRKSFSLAAFIWRKEGEHKHPHTFYPNRLGNSIVIFFYGGLF